MPAFSPPPQRRAACTFWSAGLGALPARFRQPRLLIVGCGDVGLRVVNYLPSNIKIIALTSNKERITDLRRRDIVPVLGNLDHPASFQRLAGLATHVLHLAPPPPAGWHDPRTLALGRVLRLRTPPHTLVYGSTSGVYGDLAGAIAYETLPTAAHTPRAIRRVHAEEAVRFLGKSTSKSRTDGAFIRASIMRIPGIYAPNRKNGTPKDRLLKGTPVLTSQDDVYTNHIHADDLARACLAALWHGKPQRIYNVNDDSRMKMGDYFDLAADIYGLPRPPRVSRNTAHHQLPLMLLSFMRESRQMDNNRMKNELRIKLHFPTVQTGLADGMQPNLC